MSVSERLAKLIVVYSHNGILFSHKIEWSTDAYSDVKTKLKNHGKTSDTKSSMLCD